MKIVAVVESGLKSREEYREFFRSIREEFGADGILAITTGEFLHSGMPAGEQTETRAHKLIAAGADLVAELPVYAVLLKQDSFVFAIAMLLQKLDCVQELIVPCRKGSVELLEKAGQLMLETPRPYQLELIRLKKERDLDEVIPLAVEKFVPGAGAILQNGMDRFAVEVKKALRLSYCPTRTRFAPAAWDDDRETIPEAWDAVLGDKLRETLDREEKAYFLDIFGGMEEMYSCLNGLKEQKLGFTAMAEELAKVGYPIVSARQYLIRILLGYKSINHSMHALHSYITGMHVLAVRPGSEDIFEKMKASAGIPILMDLDWEKSETERMAQMLYREITK